MAAQRDKNGRFAKGSKGGPGRPKRTTEERYIAAMVRTVRIGDWEKIVLTGISRAKAGDLGWARFIGDYLMGKPLQRQDITTKGESLNAGRLTDEDRIDRLAAVLDAARARRDRHDTGDAGAAAVGATTGAAD